MPWARKQEKKRRSRPGHSASQLTFDRHGRCTPRLDRSQWEGKHPEPKSRVDERKVVATVKLLTEEVGLKGSQPLARCSHRSPLLGHLRLAAPVRDLSLRQRQGHFASKLFTSIIFPSSEHPEAASWTSESIPSRADADALELSDLQNWLGC